MAFSSLLLLGVGHLHAQYATGDLFISPGTGPIQWYDASGNKKQNFVRSTTNTKTEGAFDSGGNFFVTVWNGDSIDKYNNSGVYQTSITVTDPNGADPESIVFDQNGNFYVSTSQGGSFGIYEYNSSGVKIGSFLPGTQVDWMDLASDNSTIYFTTEALGNTRNVYQFNVCSGATTPTVFATLGDGGPNDHGQAFQVRVLPTGGMLVADSVNVKRLDSHGTIIQTYAAANANLWVLALAGDGTSFWAGDWFDQEVVRFNLSTGQQLTPTILPGVSVGGLSVYGSSSWGAPGGGLDTGFSPGTGANNSVYTSAIQSDGKILIGGAFTTYNGTTRNYIARLNTDGSLDPNFVPSSLNGNVYAIAIQSDGRILAGGDFTLAGGQTAGRITRFNSNGTLDGGFTAPYGANSTVAAIAVQPLDSKIIVGGAFTTFSGAAHNYLVRLNSGGSVDSSYTPALGDFVYAIAIQSDGSQVIGGDANLIASHPYYARLNSSGNLDNNFTTVNLGAPIEAIGLQANGQAVIGGGFTGGIRRLTSSGTIDTTFNYGTGANNTVYSLCVSQCDGTIFIGGFFTSYNGATRDRVAKLNSDGSLNTHFTPGVGPSDNVWSVARQSDGSVVLGGAFTQVDGTSLNHIARLVGH